MCRRCWNGWANDAMTLNDMNWNIVFSPWLAPGILVALAIAGAVLVGVALWRRQRGGLLRAAVFALLIGALAGPGLVRENRTPLRSEEPTPELQSH